MGKYSEGYQIKGVVMYDGTSYDGWQRLSKDTRKKSIQFILEEALNHSLQKTIRIHGSGRTDKGVHARHQVFHFKYDGDKKLDNMKVELNQYLPEDIKVLSLEYVSSDFHSRYDSKSKTYEYQLVRESERSVFTRKYTYVVSDQIDINKMREASKAFLGTHDFKAFSTDRKDNKSTIRTIYRIDIYDICDSTTYGKNQIRIAITGDGFLYNMVRIMIGTLVEIGEGKRSYLELIKALQEKQRSLAGPTIHYEGLFLNNVEYEAINIFQI